MIKFIMDIHTSTPLIMLKEDARAHMKKKTNTLRQQLFRNIVTPSEKSESDQWNLLQGPHFVDFGAISDPHDSFFDGRKSDNATPTKHLELPTSTATESDSLVNCLRNCSISEIASDIEDTTLKASAMEDDDNTFGAHSIPEMMSVENQSNNNSTERRRSTIVHPFTFEIREREKKERKQARLQYKMANEQMNAGGFRAKLAPKIKPVPKVSNVVPIKVKKETVKLEMAAPRQINDNVMYMFGANPTTKNDSQPQSNNVNIPIVKEEKIAENIQTVIHIQENVDGKSNDQPKLQKIEPWKKKPFQVSLPKRRGTIPRSPNLLTAQRARSWEEYAEKMLAKEKQELELRKRKLAMKNQRELDEIAKLRKKTVHKALPIPQYQNIPKRPLADPLNPIFVKRRRRI